MSQETALSYFVRHKDGFCWGRFFVIDGWRGDNHWLCISAVTDFGTFGNVFGSIGPCDWRAFLSSLDRDYTMQKLRGNSAWEFDREATQASLLKHIAEAREEGGLNAKRCPAPENCVTEIEDNASEERFLSELYDCPALSELLEYSFSPRRRMTGECAEFWDRLWPLFLEAIKTEAAVAA